jgi:hypothetical protein
MFGLSILFQFFVSFVCQQDRQLVNLWHSPGFFTAHTQIFSETDLEGETGKQGLIAVCNKLLKQVYAVVKPKLYISQNIVHQDHKKP